MEETEKDFKEASDPGYQEHEIGSSSQGVDAEVEICDKIKEGMEDGEKELKAGDDQFVRDLKKNADVLDPIEKMENQTKTLSKSGAMMDASVEPTLETETEGIDKGEAALQSEGSAVDEENLSDETLKKVIELLCEELSFLLDEEILTLLASMKKETQTLVKLGHLLYVFGLDEDDVPRLAHFLLKYKNQQKVQTEDVCTETGGDSDNAEEEETDSLSNHVLPAMKSFLEQRVRSSKKLRQNSELITKTQKLEQKNVRLRMLLQQQERS